MTRSFLQQPLISRPAYGQGQSSTPVGSTHAPVAESGLPGGGPSDKGLSLDHDIPGESTFNKPEGDVREFDKADEGSIHRIDGPDDRAKKQKNPDEDERHHEDFKPTQEPPGGRPPGDPTVTDYPYRDGLPHQHYASREERAQFIVGLWRIRNAHELRVSPGMRVATKPDEVVNGLNPKFQERAQSCTASLKRADIANLRWLFSVNCGNGPKVVRLKASRAKNIVRLGKMDVDVSCSCPAWQWLGPEFHAKSEDYLDGSPRGTASVPVIRDPQGINRVCKHVAAVLSTVRGWEIPAKRSKG